MRKEAIQKDRDCRSRRKQLLALITNLFYINEEATPRSKTGFTLVESAVALTIGGILLASVYGCLASGYAIFRASRESLRANQILFTKLEAVRLCSFDQLTNTVDNPIAFSEAFDPDAQATGQGGVLYSGSLIASVPTFGTVPEAYRTNMMLVTVTVTWNSERQQHTRSMQTYAVVDGKESYLSVDR